MGSSLSIRRVDYEEYSEVMRSSRIVFNGSSFLELNSDKTDSIHYLLVEKGIPCDLQRLSEYEKESHRVLSRPRLVTRSRKKKRFLLGIT